ncbi:hypothetical protein [Brevibacillus migulae]|uniref:hypothetical protein n=1 Tax=Brevibacillus migulae TaxID=1644114 RepID=UPI00106ECF9C|nr:hypothetical protein [Brevibacillus migulae]
MEPTKIQLEKHLNDPLYKKAAEIWLETHREQIMKGAEKYPEPLGKAKWTPKQLVKHALQENADQVNYIVYLGQQADEMEEDIRWLLDNVEKMNDKMDWSRWERIIEKYYDDHS